METKIHVLFDANPLAGQKTGVGYYTEGLVKALSQNPGLRLSGFYFRPRGGRPPLPGAGSINYVSMPWMAGQAVKALRKIHVRLPWELLARRRADVLLFPDFTSWPSLFGTPKILTIHDLTFMDFPRYVRKRNLKHLERYVRADARQAKLILTISQFSKGRIADAFGIPARKILVEPVPPPPAAKAKKLADVPPKFILAIGTIEPRKNLKALAEAYALLPKESRSKYGLVIAGGQGWNSDGTLNYIKTLQATGKNIVMTGYVDEATRAALYKKAALVAVPSFYEGFGMPLLEAMSYGTPVAASNLPVFREVAGDAAIYFDPLSAVSIKEALRKLLGDERLRARQGKKGLEHLKKYSWETVAADVYKQIAKLAGRAA